MMKRVIFLLALIAVFVQCKHKEVKPIPVEGRWLNQEVITHLSEAQTADSSNAALIIGVEFSGDSLAVVTTPTESVCLPIKHNKDTVALLDALAKPVYTFVNKPNSNELVLKQNTTSIKLIRYTGKNTLYDEFAFQLNKLLFTGQYRVLPKNDTITFDGTGKITGLKEVNTFAPCIAGDCATIAEAGVNTIWLGDSTNGFYHAWKKSSDTLTIYTLASHNTALSHSYFAHKVRFKLIKVK